MTEPYKEDTKVVSVLFVSSSSSIELNRGIFALKTSSRELPIVISMSLISKF